MPSGKIARFMKITGQYLGLLSLGMGLHACGLARKSNGCNVKANGLKLSGFSGENLGDKQLSLVFLKGPSNSTEAIGELLKGEAVAATFFVKAAEIEGHEAALDKLVEQGHRIATGGYSFTALKSTEDPVIELKAADKLLAPFAFGNQYWLYGETGSLDEKARTQLNSAGLGKYIGPIHADTDGAAFVDDEKCWEQNLSVSQCTLGYFDEIVRIGHGIVAFHDNDDRSRELLHELLPELIAYGFSFQRLDQIPDLRLALTAAGGIPDAEKGAKVCNDYE